MFRVEITEGQTVMNGTTQEILAGLCCYIDALKEVGIPKKLIRKSIELSFEEYNKRRGNETIRQRNT